MRTFKRFPKDIMCEICGTNEDKECVLVPIDGTDEGNICEAIPVHVACLAKIRYNKDAGIFYINLKGGSCSGRSKKEKKRQESSEKG